MSKNFVDINNLDRFWTKAKEYVDNSNSSSLEYVYIPSIFDETYTLESSKYYDFGLSSELNIVLEEKSNNDAIEYNFQFRSGNIATKLNINGRIISDTERYCIHRVKVIGGMVDIAKSEIPQYFCIEQIGEEDCNINFNLNNPFELSVNGEDWMSIPTNSSDINIPLNVGRYIYIRANITPTGSEGIGSIISSSSHKLSGNIMSLLCGDDFKGKENLSELGAPSYLFKNLFNGSTGLIDASCLELSPKVLVNFCYHGLFQNCTSLIKSPILNAVTGALGIYMNMFQNCTSLKYITNISKNFDETLPYLGATTNVSSVGAFYINSSYAGSVSIGSGAIPTNWKVKFIGEPDYHNQYLTFNVLESGTFSFSKNDIDYRVFSPDGTLNTNWATLTAGSSTPSIPAGSKIMWKGSNLTPSSNGIGTFSSTGSYSVEGNIMSLLYGFEFEDKLDLTGFSHAFYRLFYNSTKLIDATNLILPATTLAYKCYDSMFYSCSSLTTAPELPATTLAERCYYMMFYGCSSLTTAPELPAATLAPSCYSYMFYNYYRLKSITMLATDISASDCLYYFSKASNSYSDENKQFNVFKKHPNMTSLPVGYDGIPSDWSVYDAFNETEIKTDYSKKYLTFEAVEDCDFGFETDYVGDGYLSYSVDDGASWSGVTAVGWNEGTIVHVSAGSKIMWKSDFGVDGQFGQFTTTGKYNISGNIMSLLYEDDFEGKTDLIGGFGSTDAETRFAALFASSYSEDSFVVDASNLILPTTTLTPYCYLYMFMGNPYLIAAPELPATTLAERCYMYMFLNCTSLTSSPELPATNLADTCYGGMFAGCTSLNSITMLATDSAPYCFDDWVLDVASTGTFTKAASMTSLPTGDDGIPEGWTVVNK